MFLNGLTALLSHLIVETEYCVQSIFPMQQLSGSLGDIRLKADQAAIDGNTFLISMEI